jgi:hypothetical protein
MYVTVSLLIFDKFCDFRLHWPLLRARYRDVGKGCSALDLEACYDTAL